MKMFPFFFSGIKSAQFIIQLWQKASAALNLGMYFSNKVARMFKKTASATKLCPILECLCCLT